MKKYLFLLLSLFLFSCSDDEPTLPSCISAQLSDFQVDADCVGDNLTTWDFNGEVVYCFAFGACSIGGIAEIFDANCTKICTLANGLTSCQGIPWAENASNESLIWIKE